MDLKRDSTNKAASTQTGRRQRGGLGLWTLVMLVLVGATIGAILAGLWVFSNVKARLLVTDAPAMVTVPEPFNVSATILNRLDIAINGKVHTRVPVHKTLSVPVNEPLNLLVKFDAYVPIRLQVAVTKTITIDKKMAIDTILQADLLGDTFALPIHGNFPVKAKVPLHIVIPVDQMVHLQFTAPIKATLKQNLEVPLDTVIEADVPLKTRMSVPINNALKAVVDLPDKALPVEIVYADLNIPLDNLAFDFGSASANSQDRSDKSSGPQP